MYCDEAVTINYCKIISVKKYQFSLIKRLAQSKLASLSNEFPQRILGDVKKNQTLIIFHRQLIECRWNIKPVNKSGLKFLN